MNRGSQKSGACLRCRHAAALVAAVVLFAGAAATALAVDGGPEGEPARQELHDLAVRLTEGVRAGDVEFLVALLDDAVVFDARERPREEIAGQLRSGSGRLYAYLFDTAQYRSLEADRRAEFVGPEESSPLPPLETYRSVQDHLRDAPDVTVIIHLVEPLWPAGARFTLGLADFHWTGRPDVEDVGNCAFVLRADGWKLRTPFSLHVWGTAPPASR